VLPPTHRMEGTQIESFRRRAETQTAAVQWLHPPEERHPAARVGMLTSRALRAPRVVTEGRRALPVVLLAGHGAEPAVQVGPLQSPGGVARSQWAAVQGPLQWEAAPAAPPRSVGAQEERPPPSAADVAHSLWGVERERAPALVLVHLHHDRHRSHAPPLRHHHQGHQCPVPSS
jgi:hypothetical protein